MPRPLPKSVRFFVIGLVAVVFAGGGWLAYRYLDPGGEGSALVHEEAAPTFESPDHAVQLRVPNGAMAADTRVEFSTLSSDVAIQLNQTVRGVVAASKPVDIKVMRGSLAPDRTRVTLKYDPRLIPTRLTDRQVGMMVFDTNLAAWIPILGAEIDPATRTVSAITPHFSWFTAVVLEPAKAVVDFGGKVIKTVIDATITVAKWTINLATDLGKSLIEDLFAIPPELRCNGSTHGMAVTTKSMLDLLRACTQPGSGGDVTVRLRNGFAFPLRTEKMPAGMTLRMSDVWDNGTDLVNLVRNLFWVTQQKAVLSGTDIASMTAKPEMKSSATIKLDIDSDAIAVDMALGVLMVIAPEAGAAKGALKSSMESALKGAGVSGKAQEASTWVKSTYDTLDCIVRGAHVDLSKVFSLDGIKHQAGVVYGCLDKILSALNLRGALQELISIVKVLPEVAQTVLYPVAGSIGEQLGVYKSEPPTATVTRSQVDDTFVGRWAVHGSILNIRDDGAGQLGWNAGPCTLSLSDTRMCWGNATISFSAGPKDTIVGVYDEVWYSVGTDGPVVTDYEYAADDYQPGQRFTLARNDEHTLVSSSNSGNPYWCDDYAMRNNDSIYDICGA